MIFSQLTDGIESEEQFNKRTLEAFRYQLQHNPVYAEYTDALGIHASDVNHYRRIPFLPIEFYKTREVYAAHQEPAITFYSSGTTLMSRSTHHVADLKLYRAALMEGFRYFYGDTSDFLICALTPSLEESPNSSLAFMIQTWIDSGAISGSGFYLKEPERLLELLQMPAPGLLLIGLTYALLDFAERYPVSLSGSIIMETGGMKGKRKEMVREEVHSTLKSAFSVNKIHSEYGMAEMLSQAYSRGEGDFKSPPWMKILIRDPNDPLSLNGKAKTGGINIIDLANWYSCPFLATQDLGRISEDGSFEVLGRFDYSDLRGCNLMFSE
jgi:hypothetical protein